ncbi:NACHT, LRR and PYD domains-containing protein 4E isoform X1 [Hydra vulgaris]|uniref:NACHT, LRR and PYD domains-containing protein 4E isoform X1 n=1 Tax=Hydra vulgaris TaxID=6087 RepID=UPI001F5FCCFC|nr:NACHT, LRR and PYD domains-containing protein 4E [Hydra vulgaris]
MDPKLKFILIENLSPEWKKFAYGTGINSAVVDYVDLDDRSYQDKLETFLNELVKRNATNFVSMIEKSLKDLGNMRVLNEVNTFFAVRRLKLHYITTYGDFNQQINHLFTNHFDLVTVDEIDYKNSLEKNEWEDFIEKQNGYETITFDEVFAHEKPLILISGVAGIGKTYFLEKCIYRWAEGQVLKNVDFFFYFKIKKLNDFQNISSLNELIKKFYGNILKVSEISNQWSVALIFDGLDKFVHLDKFFSHKLGKYSDMPLINTLEDVLSMKRIKCIFAGRVQAIAKFSRTSKESNKIRNINIMGLSCHGIKFYMETTSLSNTLKNDLNEILSSSIEGKSLLSVPLYLKAVCEAVIKLFLVSVKTFTELQILILYHFIQNTKPEIPLFDKLMQNKNIFLEICKVAFVLIKKKSFYMLQEEIHHINNKHGFETIGLIEISQVNKQYEFTHSILMKLCASIYMYLSVSPHIALQDILLHECIPSVCGLAYSREKVFFSLFRNFEKPGFEKKSWLQDIFQFNDRRLFIRCLYESQTSFNDILNVSMEKIIGWYQNHSLAEIMAEKYFIKKTVELQKQMDMKDGYDIKVRLKGILKQIVEAIQNVSRYSNKINDNENILKKVENIQKDILGEKHEDTLATQFLIAMCLYNKKVFSNAENLFREVENRQIEILGDRKEPLIKTKYMIAMCLYNKNQFSNAEYLLREVKNMQEEVFGTKNEDTINTNYWIAICLFDKRQFENAEKIFKEVEGLQNEIFGEKHQKTLKTRYWIAMCLYDKKKFDAAEKSLREVENMQYKYLGEKHEDTLTTKHWIARCLYEKKKIEEAEKLFREVEILRKEVLGETHVDTLNTKRWIGSCVSKK